MLVTSHAQFRQVFAAWCPLQPSPSPTAVDAATTNGCSPLYIAANNGFAEAAALLLELGADPDLETSSGCTPLHAAALNGHAAVAECLVAAGCDVDLQSQNGSSALHNAASGALFPVCPPVVNF
jgi:ankyrin repeat protein